MEARLKRGPAIRRDKSWERTEYDNQLHSFCLFIAGSGSKGELGRERGEEEGYHLFLALASRPP